MKNIIALLLVLLVCPIHADSVAYGESKVIEFVYGKYLFRHAHDWHLAHNILPRTKLDFWTHPDSYTEPEKVTDLDPELLKAHLSPQNVYAYIECQNLETGAVIFKKTAPALTHLSFDPESQILIGLSNIKIFNPMRFILMDMKGMLLAYGERQNLGEAGVAWQESITNYTFWYEEENPDVSIQIDRGNYILSVLDIKGESRNIFATSAEQSLPDFKEAVEQEQEQKLKPSPTSRNSFWINISILTGLFVAIFFVRPFKRKEQE